MNTTKTWGYEIEWGDIPRCLPIPEHLGSWEYAEVDILNLQEPYTLTGVDPLGLEPPVGGEINTTPDKSIKEQVDKIISLRDMFTEVGSPPTASLINHGHLHVFVEGLREDIQGLKKLTRYILDNQEDLIRACYQFKPDPEMKKLKNATSYLKLDGGRMMPEWMGDNIINMSESFEDFIRIQCCGKDGVSRGRPFRYAVNTYCMKHTGTIEFRCFRSSTKRKEIESCFRIAERFIDSALGDQKPIKEILQEEEFTFPPFVWNSEHYKAWIDTKWDKSRGNKKRQFIELL